MKQRTWTIYLKTVDICLLIIGRMVQKPWVSIRDHFIFKAIQSFFFSFGTQIAKSIFCVKEGERKRHTRAIQLMRIIIAIKPPYPPKLLQLWWPSQLQSLKYYLAVVTLVVIYWGAGVAVTPRRFHRIIKRTIESHCVHSFYSVQAAAQKNGQQQYQSLWLHNFPHARKAADAS